MGHLRFRFDCVRPECQEEPGTEAQVPECGDNIRTQAENLVGMAQEQELAGYRVPVVNTSLLGSETCEALLERHPEAEFAATYWERDGRRHWSLRSRANGDFDVSQIAPKLGGGGHPHAGGFTEEPCRWESMNPAD